MSTQSQDKSLTKIPLRAVLIVPFVIQVILITGLVGYISFLNGQRAVNNVANQLLNELTHRIEEHLYDFLAIPHQINQLNTNAIRQRMPDARDPIALERYFWEQIQVCDSVTSIYFGNPQGGLANAGREGADGSLYVIATDGFARGPFRKYATDGVGNRTELLTTVPDFDARTRGWYADAVAKADATWSDVYILFTGQDMAISASRPVYDEQDNLLGVVAVDIFASHINDFLKKLQIGETGLSFIMERSGLLVASSTDEAPFTEPNEDEAQQRIYASGSTNPIIRDAADYLTEHVGDYHDITEERQFEFEIDGRRHFLQVAPVKDEYGIDWLAVVVIPESDFMAQINTNNRTTALLIGIALLAAIVVGIITASGVTRPILRLNAATHALARGKWEQPSSVGWISEIDELTHSFDQMASKLRQTLEGLSSEIAERKQAEEALRESEEQLNLAMAGANDGIWDWNLEENTAHFDDRYYTMAGYEPQEFPADFDAWVSHVHPDDIERSKEAINQYLAGEIPRYDVEFRFRRKDGAWMWIRSRGKTVEYDDVGTPIRFIGTHSDITARKQAEEALRESEEKYRLLVENQTDLIVKVDTDGRFQFVSLSYCKLFGKSEEELLGQSFMPLIHEEDRESTATAMEGLYRPPHTAYMEQRAMTNDGWRWLGWLDTAMLDEAGNVTAIIGVGRDITERKAAEEALQTERKRAQQYFDIAGVAFVVLDREGRITRMNRRGLDLLGYQATELIGENWFETCLPERLREDVYAVFKRIMAGDVEPVEGFENLVLTKEGEERIVAWHNTALRDDEGHIIGSLSSGEDITERKRAEEALRESERKYRTLIEQSNDAIYLLYEDRFEIINPRFTELLGITPEEARAPNFDFMSLVAPQSRSMIEERERRLAQGHQPPPSYEFTAQDKEGNEIEVEVSVSYIPYRDGMATQGMLRDVTERKRLERQLRQHERLAAVGQLAAGIAHDFRNLLSTIILYAGIGLRNRDLPPDLRKNLNTIIGESRKAADMVQQILDFSGRAMVEMQPLDLKALTTEVTDILRRTIPEHIHLRLTTGPEDYIVHADAGRIQQALMNLALNAHDAMPEGGDLQFELSKILIGPEDKPPVVGITPGMWICLTVADTGTGMTEEVQAHLFEPFFTTKEVGQGTGLGLAQVFGIVRHHNGYIDVETQVGQGTTFRIYLPASEAEEKIVEHETSVVPQGQGELILLVEDNKRLREASQDLLELLGYRSLTASNGSEALAVYDAADSEIALVITDLIMPEMGGKELVQELRSTNPHLKALAITGYVEEEVAEELKTVGFQDVIHKPFAPDTLARVIRRALDAK